MQVQLLSVRNQSHTLDFQCRRSMLQLIAQAMFDYLNLAFSFICRLLSSVSVKGLLSSSYTASSASKSVKQPLSPSYATFSSVTSVKGPLKTSYAACYCISITACYCIFVKGPLTPDVGEGAGKVLELLLDDEAKRGEHGDAAMSHLSLAPAPQLLYGGCVAQQVGRVEDVLKGGGDAWHGLSICNNKQESVQWLLLEHHP